jgi:hypothetical protein
LIFVFTAAISLELPKSSSNYIKSKVKSSELHILASESARFLLKYAKIRLVDTLANYYEVNYSESTDISTFK